jgi:hypothetical protein
MLRLEQAAVDLGFNQRLPPDWLREKIAAQARHFIQPALIHRAASGLTRGADGFLAGCGVAVARDR